MLGECKITTMFRGFTRRQTYFKKNLFVCSSNYNTSSNIQKVLIANRGEISCRIIKTLRKLGITSVALYSEVDKKSLHVLQADESYYIGLASPQESYLNKKKIISIAKEANVQAIHPGYGFLSENADFADLCNQANLIFIGPSAKAIRDMGIKSTAKLIMEKAGVPIIKGYHGKEQDGLFLKNEAKKIGFPVVIKALKGGGGKGMRIITSEDQFDSQLESAKREAMNSFGDDAMLIEKYIEDPRHVEVQIFGDKQGNYLYLFERDCSIQRRHQKIIEEAPAPHISEEIRHSLGKAAVQAAKAVDYIGAGTVEFIMDKNKKFYFMEMNTRLQVEHPVTEMITGIDLVEWQILVAAGKNLPLSQEELKVNGHSFEARIYAEDPENNFMPGAGMLSYLNAPQATNYIRIETGVQQGDHVSIHYDPMIAKLVVWGKDRTSALMKLTRCLSEYCIIGVTTNIKFLSSLSKHPQFLLGHLHTEFISYYEKELLIKKIPSDEEVCSVVLATLFNELKKKKGGFKNNQYSPFSLLSGLIPNISYKYNLTINSNGQEFKVNIEYKGHDHYIMIVNNNLYDVKGFFSNEDSNILFCNINNKSFPIKAIIHEEKVHLFTKDNCHEFHLSLPKFISNAVSEISQSSAVAPMPGVIEKINVHIGDKVKIGDPLVVMIAMKMEYVIKAQTKGTIEKLFYDVGESVPKNAQLLQINTDES